MGFGDDLIVTSIVKKARSRTNRPIVVGNGAVVSWSEVFENNPYILRKPTPDCVWVRNVEGNRPYIDYYKSNDVRFAWKPFHAEPGELYFSPEELRWQESDFCYIEPNVKTDVFADNKDWGFQNWQKVVDLTPEIRWVQGRGRALRGVIQLDTKSFRDACALLSRASLFVGGDGGLGHAAAALGKPAVLVLGGLIDPKMMWDYPNFRLICKATKFCGSIKPCDHCREAFRQVTVEEVVEAIRG